MNLGIEELGGGEERGLQLDDVGERRTKGSCGAHYVECAEVVQSAPTGTDVRTDVLGLLFNMHAGELLAESDTPTGRPLVRPVTPIDAIERVLVEPPETDRETALRLIQEGTAIESLGAVLIFNPMLRDELLRLRRR